MADQKVISYLATYHKDSQWLLLIIVMFQLCVIGALVFLNMLLWRADLPPAYFPMTAEGRIIKTTPLDQPSVSTAAVLNWFNEAIVSSYSFNYRNYEKEFKRLQIEYFDKRGLASYIRGLQTDPNFNRVAREKLIVSAKAIAVPEVLKDGVIQGRYAWQVSMRVKLRFENALMFHRQIMLVTAIIWRVPESESPVGIKITRFNTKVESLYSAAKRL